MGQIEGMEIVLSVIIVTSGDILGKSDLNCMANLHVLMLLRLMILKWNNRMRDHKTPCYLLDLIMNNISNISQQSSLPHQLPLLPTLVILLPVFLSLQL